MIIKKENYPEYVKKKTTNSPIVKDCIWAFLVGGAICTLGQLIYNCMLKFRVPSEDAKIWLPVIMIFLGAFFTGFGIYDKLGKHAGAGSIIPITGFSNSIVSSAMEFKKEGFILGVGAKMFTIAGPVLVYGITTSVLYGVVRYIIMLFMR